MRTEGRIKTVKEREEEREEESYGICSGNKLSYEKVSSSCSGQSDKYACETRRNLRIYRQKWYKIGTEKTIHYLEDYRYWNRDIGLYVQLVA